MLNYIEPIDRSISTKVIPQVMSVVVLLNVSAKSETVSDTVKKSKDSHDHLAKETAKKSPLLRIEHSQ